jgi:ubiquinone/menaquinone biosynthesis C-methylase UbiE
LSFPYHDRNWVAAADWVRARVKPEDRILAPDIFWWRFPKIHRYRNPFLRPQAEYDWAILHKGELDRLPQSFLVRLVRTLRPVFANEVFVVLGSSAEDDVLDCNNPHVGALFARLDELEQQGDRPPPDFADDPVLPDPGSISQLATLSDSQIADAMDAYWTNGGYLFKTKRDKAYDAEIDRYIAAFVRDAAGHNILDVGCGTCRLGSLAADDVRVVGIDISRVAIDKAREAHRTRGNIRFEVMNAHHLQLPDESFDKAIHIDTIEHVRDARRALAEIARVLRPGGQLLVSVANRDSVHQVLARKLGYPEFLTSFQHFKEFNVAEMTTMLEEERFIVLSTAGIFLYPYWGVPGIDNIVRHITDEDAEFVELTRLLGERAGAEYAYTSVFVAGKPTHA